MPISVTVTVTVTITVTVICDSHDVDADDMVILKATYNPFTDSGRHTVTETQLPVTATVYASPWKVPAKATIAGEEAATHLFGRGQ